MENRTAKPDPSRFTPPRKHPRPPACNLHPSKRTFSRNPCTLPLISSPVTTFPLPDFHISQPDLPSAPGSGGEDRPGMTSRPRAFSGELLKFKEGRRNPSRLPFRGAGVLIGFCRMKGGRSGAAGSAERFIVWDNGERGVREVAWISIKMVLNFRESAWKIGTVIAKL